MTDTSREQHPRPVHTDQHIATVFRMVTPDHVCPYGLKTVDLLRREGFEIDDRHLDTEEEADRFRERWDVDTTPQTFIGNELVGTLDDVRDDLGKNRTDGGGTSYRPVVTLFAITFLMAVGAAWVVEDRWLSVRTVEWSSPSPCVCSAT